MSPPLDTNTVPSPPVYALPPRASFPVWGKLLIGCGLLLILFIVIVGVAISSAFRGRTGELQTSFCAMNLRATQRGINLYSQDYDETLPRAAAWMDDVTPYLKEPTEFKCPVVRVANPKGFGYAFNSKLSASKSAKISEPISTAVVYDSTSIERNASDAVTTLPTVPRHTAQNRKKAGTGTNHFNVILYADGHVRYVNPDGTTLDAADTPMRRRIFGRRPKSQ